MNIKSNKWTSENSLAFAALLFVSAIWGLHGVFGKSIGDRIEPFPLTLLRFTAFALFFLPWYSNLGFILRRSKTIFLQIVISGLCFSILFPVFFYKSLMLLTPVTVLMLVSISPFFATLIERYCFNERIPSKTWVGMLVSLLGAAVLIIDQWSEAASTRGIVYGLISSAAFAVYTASSRKLFQTLPFRDVLMATSVVGTIGLWMIAPFVGGIQAAVLSLSYFQPIDWAELAFIVFLVSLLGYVLNGYGLKRLPAGIASSLTLYPQPIFAAAAQWVWLGTAASPSTLLSAVLIFGGTAIMRSSSKNLVNKADGTVPLRRPHPLKQS
ncbi:hypothetical protein SD71_10105 [Cohnella kolymensis]|uniref:EamA domain-containing protein n=1 Tax=Cohnella kolymensis TaxID=1590652 RepID=A0ABR5A532_9BACL|nr:EamA family transporter [Cohnella kolymensis]KIL35763.1 hypothetical protein SD71_10105 [Cohnella kolymensis]